MILGEQNKDFAIQNMGERGVSFCEHCSQYFFFLSQKRIQKFYKGDEEEKGGRGVHFGKIACLFTDMYTHENQTIQIAFFFFSFSFHLF